MKDSLFEMLLSLFEKTLAQLKEKEAAENKEISDNEKQSETLASSSREVVAELIQPARGTSIRVFTYDEQMKLTKASYQFLMRLLSWGVIDSEVMELIMNQLLFSDSRFVTLEETKWTLRNTLIGTLNAEQFAFLDLVLYQKEEKYPLH